MARLIRLLIAFLSTEYGRYPAAMMGYVPSDSLVDKQGMIAQEIILCGRFRQT